MVRTNTLRRPGRGRRGRGAAERHEARAGALDRRQWPLVLASIRLSARMLAVAEAARNVACSGARPMAATNCLNFGNPEKPEVMWQFSRADRRHRGSVHGAGNSDHRRQREFLQRDAGPADRSDAGSRRARH